MEYSAAPIIAANWMEWVFPIIVFILYTLGQLMSLKKNNKPKQLPRGPQPRDPAIPPQKPRSLEEKLRGEVEAFLRQVRGDQPDGEETAPVVVTQRPLVVKAEQTPQRLVEIERPRESIQEHVAKRLSTAEIGQHARALGGEVSQADEKFQTQLQQKFQHHLGSLEPEQERRQPRRRENKVAAEIAELLRSPSGMRQVIIASEILRRPEI